MENIPRMLSLRKEFMKIIALSDIHSRLDYLAGIKDDLADADLVLIAGDITNFMAAPEANRIISAIARINPNILAVAGNCDLPAVDEYLSQQNINLNCRCLDFNGITFSGLNGFVPPQHQKKLTLEAFFKISLDQLAANIPPDKPLVLVTHQPARGTLVDLAGGKHCGSDAIFEFIADAQPLLAISGHMHDSPGIDRIAETTVINPGSFCHGSYAYIEIDKNTVKKTELR
jgi:hypothetical protein